MDVGSVSTRRAAYTAIASACVFLLTAIIQAIYAGAHGSDRPNPNNYPNGHWDINFLKAVWQWRRGVASLEIVMSFFSAIGLFLFLYTVQVMREMFATEKGILRHVMANAFIIGGFIRLFEFFQTEGLEVGARYISELTDLPDQAWISLTITHGLLRAIGALVFAADLISIIVGVSIISYISLRGTSEEKFKFSRRHGIFGIIVAVFLVILWFIEIGTFLTYVASQGDFVAIGVFGGIVGFLLWPSWLIWLGVQLRHKELPTSIADKGQNQALLHANPNEL